MRYCHFGVAPVNYSELFRYLNNRLLRVVQSVDRTCLTYQFELQSGKKRLLDFDQV